MERIKSLGVVTPVLKVNNRDRNIAFYQKNLGFKVWHEENAFVDLGAANPTGIKLILEESPSTRARKVKGCKKLNQIVIRAANPAEVETLLARGASYDKLYRGSNGWAFETISPEGDCFLLHSENDFTSLTEVTETVHFDHSLTDFTYLTDFEVEKIKINTPDVKRSQRFYGSLFGDYKLLEFIAAQGPDLQIAEESTWDLVALELSLTASLSLTTVQADLAARGIRSFVNKRATFLVLQDPNGLDITLRP